MTSIRQLFAEAVEDPPPSKLSATEIFRIGQSHWRRRLAGLASALVGGGAVSILLATVILQPGGLGERPAPGPTMGQPVELPQGPLQWVGMADADNLFVIAYRCPPTPQPDPSVVAGHPRSSLNAEPCSELLASTDGGKTWSSRGIVPQDVTILGDARNNRVLTLQLGHRNLDAQASPARAKVSVDGGDSWAYLENGSAPMATVPAGATVSFGMRPLDQVMVVDPTTRQLRPLANQPPALKLPDPARPKSNGHLWVAGFDPTSLVPAIAVSHDAGQSWSTKVLPGALAAAAGQENFIYGGNAAVVAEVNATTAYAVWTPHVTAVLGPSATAAPDGPIPSRIYRTSDGGQTWQLMTSSGPTGATAIWATDDGRLVLQMGSYNGAGVAFAYQVSSDGTSFDRAAPPGLPENARSDGRVGSTEYAAYISEDGWNFRQVWHD